MSCQGQIDHSNVSCQMIRIFGSNVSDFSSQYGAEARIAYAAHNLAGKCNVYPNYGDFTQACVFVSLMIFL